MGSSDVRPVTKIHLICHSHDEIQTKQNIKNTSVTVLRWHVQIRAIYSSNPLSYEIVYFLPFISSCHIGYYTPLTFLSVVALKELGH